MAKEGTPEGISRADEVGARERMMAAVEAERVLRVNIVQMWHLAMSKSEENVVDRDRSRC
jgi:hypothetical protein